MKVKLLPLLLFLSYPLQAMAPKAFALARYNPKNTTLMRYQRHHTMPQRMINSQKSIIPATIYNYWRNNNKNAFNTQQTCASYGTWSKNKFNNYLLYGSTLLGAAFVALANDEDETKKKQLFLPNNRPTQLQAAIDEAFEYNKKASKDDWLHKGAWGFYGLVALDEERMLKHLVGENSEKKDIYIIDVGCARGGWGKEAMTTLLEYAPSKKSGQRFHIFSVTGGQECNERVKQIDNVTLYQFNQFKIENIDEEFAKRGFDLNGKVDLIVSRWTMRHLVDPFGTLKRMYGLLAPTQGKLLSNGFLFMSHDSNKVKAFPENNENILASTKNTTILFRKFNAGRDAGEFLLVRNDQNALEIPLEYTGNVHSVGYGWQNASARVTVYSKGPLTKSTFEQEYIKESPWEHYCGKDDQACKNLYHHLAQKKLFFTEDEHT